MVYLIALLLALAGSLINNRVSKQFAYIFYIILCIYMILLIGLRYKVGVDTYNYMSTFNKIPTLHELLSSSIADRIRFEPGFLLLNSLCKTIYPEFWLLQLTLSIITTSCVFIFIDRYCINKFIGIVLYIIIQWLYFSTEILRESAAIGIFLVNYKNLEEKKWLKYYLWSLLSISFHYSAIIILFFPLVKLLQSKLIFLLSCLFFIGITPVVEHLNEILNIASITGRLSFYTEGAQDLNLRWRLGEFIRSAFPAIATLIAFKLNKQTLRFKPIILLQIIFCCGAFAIPLIFARFTNYTSLFLTVGIANLITFPTVTTWFKSLFISFILLTQSYYIYTMIPRWYPYSSIFYPESYPERSMIYRHGFMPWLKFK